MSQAGSQIDSLGSTSASLIERVRGRDQAAWRRMVRLYGPLVHYWFRQSQLQEADLADVFQEVFRSVALSIAQFGHGGEGQTFRGWLRTITRNKLRDHFRQRSRHPAAVGGSSALARWQQFVDSEDDDDLPATMDEERALLVQRALGLLRTDFEERTWRAFWRTAVDGESPADVGVELEMSAAAVRKAKSRVLQRLREELGDEV